MKNGSYVKGLRYELIVKAIFEQILTEGGDVNVRVEHLATVQGTQTQHTIDVLWEFTIGGILYRTVVQAKNWNTKIKQEHVLAFKAILQDIPGQPRGVMVSRSGFQKGAKKVAEASGVELYLLGPLPKEPVILSVGGWATMRLNPEMLYIECEVFHPQVSIAFKLAAPLNGTGADTRDHLLHSNKMTEFLLFNEEGEQSRSVSDLILNMLGEFSTQHCLAGARTHVFDVPTYIRHVDRAERFRILELTANIVINRETRPPVPLVPSGLVPFVLRNIQTGGSSIHRVPSGEA